MNTDLVLDFARDAIYTVIMASGPLLLLALVVGLVVSIFQTITSIQEQTLAFVPKILAIFVGALVFGPFMGTQILEFFKRAVMSFGEFIVK
ncbi:flagellar biosynthetic protein FliQ [Clostridiales bacterium COT073_COT-073]|nr:flagellar biosynthetic protein FliQ [Clostridiales bacterium COT073_COT-073]